MIKRPKRPRGPAQLAKLMIDIASGEVEDREPTPEEQGKDAAAAALGRKGGAAGPGQPGNGTGRIALAEQSPQTFKNIARNFTAAMAARESQFGTVQLAIGSFS